MQKKGETTLAIKDDVEFEDVLVRTKNYADKFRW